MTGPMDRANNVESHRDLHSENTEEQAPLCFCPQCNTDVSRPYLLFLRLITTQVVG